MNKLKLLLKNINLLNIILIAAILSIASYVILPLLNMSVKFTPATPKQISLPKGEETAQSQIPSPSDYLIVAEQNLFHPERKIPPEKKEEQPLPKPEFVLYGTLITDDVSIAYLEDKKSPRTTPGRGRRQTALKKGDTMSGYTLKEIDPDKIVMVKGEETLIVKVIEPNVKKDREGGSASAPQAQVSPHAQKVQRPTPTPPRPEQATLPKKTPYRPQ
jgi:hypothetical protein